MLFGDAMGELIHWSQFKNKLPLEKTSFRVTYSSVLDKSSWALRIISAEEICRSDREDMCFIDGIFLKGDFRIFNAELGDESKVCLLFLNQRFFRKIEIRMPYSFTLLNNQVPVWTTDVHATDLVSKGVVIEAVILPGDSDN